MEVRCDTKWVPVAVIEYILGQIFALKSCPTYEKSFKQKKWSKSLPMTNIETFEKKEQ